MELPNNLVYIPDVEENIYYINPHRITCVLEHANDLCFFSVYMEGLCLQTRAPIMDHLRFDCKLLTTTGVLHFNESDLLFASEGTICFHDGNAFSTPNYPPMPEQFEGDMIVG